MKRRRSLTILAAGGAAATLLSRGGTAMPEDDKEPATGFPQLPPGRHVAVPLPFDPKKLRGLSERLMVSHHENNYGGALKNLNKVEEELSSVTKDTPGFAVAGLKERELMYTNSVVLHEMYFGNLGGSGKADGPIAAAIGASFGSLARWEELFRATGMSLAGGSGWTILELSFHTADLRTYWAGNHTHSASFGMPLLVLDMYEHAYHIDFGAAAAKYVEAFFANVTWEEVNRRYERAVAAAKSLRA